MNFINQIEPVYGEEEKKAVAKYMDSGGWLTEFKHTRELEGNIAQFVGAKHCSVVTNGTAALMLAYAAIGLKPNDEVLVPDYTFVATASTIGIFGAKPVFVDIEKQSLCMDFEKTMQAVTPKTKAVVLVDINARYPQKIREFAQFCKERGIWLIEDSAQALGSNAFGKPLGTWGDIGCYSFSTPKIISTGQGGAIVTNSSELYDKMKRIRNFGRESGDADHFVLQGWNFKTTDIQSVIGIEQMKKLPWRVARKKEMGKMYWELLGGIGQLELTPTDFGQTALCSYDVLLKDAGKKKQLAEFLTKNSIGSRPFYPPLHSEPAFGLDVRMPISQEVSERGLWLPSASNLTDEQVKYVCSKVKEFFSN
ncbi:Aspartate aminotransferase [Candidatus Anstonella stagnisolia]|nr:Aspartate aminotransferase [Candidatus Anstonella stagnisolia]